MVIVMKDSGKKYNIKHEVRKLISMLLMVFVVVAANVAVVSATAEDDAAAGQILNEQNGEENRTNINEPGSAQTAEDLDDFNISNGITIEHMVTEMEN